MNNVNFVAVDRIFGEDYLITYVQLRTETKEHDVFYINCWIQN